MADPQTGSGLVFPFELEGGKVPMSTGVGLIQASLKNLLDWPGDSKYFNEEFGSFLYTLLDDPLDSITIHLVKEYILQVIAKYETRIELVSAPQVVIKSNMPYTLKVFIPFRIKSTGFQDVYTYYIKINNP